MEIYKSELNKEQYEAVTTTDGAVLVLAGAGTGKTRVITYRIAYLIKEKGVTPGNILAVTFTNKASGEMKSRLKELVGPISGAVWMGTFHSISLTILRKDGERVGLPSSFGIIDQDDRLSLIREGMKELDIDVKKYSPKQYLNIISSFKNTQNYVEDLLPEDILPRFKDVYKIYQKKLFELRLIDFDDMLSLTVRLFMKDPDILNEYKELFKYILVDEYQDTNLVQFKFLYLLSGSNGNLCVVGDDDQSIYGWRGAEIKNILEFDNIFKNVKEIKLIGNYRSGRDILEHANNLIENNRYRRGKILQSCTDKDSIVFQRTFGDERSEADFIAIEIEERIRKGIGLSDIAILYRTNAQSRNFEVALNRKSIPYKVVGGTGFYQRREIKDILSYLKVLDNPYDGVSFRRSIKNPPRGVGDSSIDKILDYSSSKGISIIEGLKESVNSLGRSSIGAKQYIDIIELASNVEGIKEKIDYIVTKIAYKEFLKQFEEPDESLRRIENVLELYSAAAAFEEMEGNSNLNLFLSNTSLVTSQDDSYEGSIKLMSLHAAKGLEFHTVFLTGLEEGLFPLGSAEGEADIEEERRLCYVGITRAMYELYITNVVSRLLYGKKQMMRSSRFLEEAGVKKIEKLNSSFGNVFNDYKSKPTNTFSNKVSSIPDNLVYKSSVKKGVFNISDKVYHNVFGDGVVVAIEGSNAVEKITVQFKKSGLKKILAGFLSKKDS